MFQAHPPRLQAAKESPPWLFQKPLPAVRDATHSCSQKDHPCDWPSAVPSISRIRKGQLASCRKCHRRISLLTLCRQVPTQGTGCTSEPHCPHPSKRTGGHLPQGPAGARQPRRKSLSGSQTRKEPETNAASDWQWREFYYYPIITLGSVPKWSMLPPWCHFLLSWLETKSGSMGAILMMSLQFTATAPPSLSVCLKYTQRSILPKNG